MIGFLVFASLLLVIPVNNSDSAKPVFFPRGVADSAGRVGYVASADGQIGAIDLASGKLLWVTDVASRPLVITGDRLVAQSYVEGKPNALRIVALDVTRNGAPILTSDPVLFPEWV